MISMIILWKTDNVILQAFFLGCERLVEEAYCSFELRP